jgi:hypothetical protein
MSDKGKFMAVRMIILDTEQTTREDFEEWMTKKIKTGKPFLDEMGRIFKPDGRLWRHRTSAEGIPHQPELAQDSGLERIILLRGIDEDAYGIDTSDTPPPPYPLQSHQHSATRAGSTEAGANADYAWITLWTDRRANRAAWSYPWRPDEWFKNENGVKSGLWWEFRREKCLDRFGPAVLRDVQFFSPSVPYRPPHGPPYDYFGSGTQRGAGVGCLVEGFEIIYDENKDSEGWEVI